MSGVDVSLIENISRPGTLEAHDPTCPVVTTARLLEEPIFTLIHCKQLPDCPRHSCLEDNASAAGR